MILAIFFAIVASADNVRAERIGGVRDQKGTPSCFAQMAADLISDIIGAPISAEEFFHYYYSTNYKEPLEGGTYVYLAIMGFLDGRTKFCARSDNGGVDSAYLWSIEQAVKSGRRELPFPDAFINHCQHTVDEPNVLWQYDLKHLEKESADPEVMIQTVIKKLQEGSLVGITYDRYTAMPYQFDELIRQISLRDYTRLTTHASVAVGIQQNSEGKTLVKVRNSYGEDFCSRGLKPELCEGGYFWVEAETLKNSLYNIVYFEKFQY